jgi:hypothetical protein
MLIITKINKEKATLTGASPNHIQATTAGHPVDKPGDTRVAIGGNVHVIYDKEGHGNTEVYRIGISPNMFLHDETVS